MEVLYPEMVSVHVDRYGFFEEGLTAFALKYLKPGMAVCDVGGHFGYFSRLAEFLTRDDGTVHTFEPTPSTFGILKRNTQAYPSIKLNQLAVADQAGELELTDYGTAFAAFNTISDGNLGATAEDLGLEPVRTSVRTTSLDGYVEESGMSFDFVKLDAEGAEKLILEGMSQILRSDRPTISMEVGDSEDRESRDCLAVLLSYGYEILKYVPSSRGFQWVEQDSTYRHDNLFFVHSSRRGLIN